MRNIIVTLAACLVLALAGAGGVSAKPDFHCIEGGTKIESGSAGNNVILPAGTFFCVKASTDNTGILVADGATTLREYLYLAGIINGSGQQGRDVSYYVIYSTPEASPTPEVSPSPPSETGSPTAEPSVTPSVEPTGAPSLEPSSGPSALPSPLPTLPPTSTATDSTDEESNVLLIVFCVALVGMLLLLQPSGRTQR